MLEREDINNACLGGVDAILVPGGFGQRRFEGKVTAIRHARRFFPFFVTLADSCQSMTSRVTSLAL